LGRIGCTAAGDRARRASQRRQLSGLANPEPVDGAAACMQDVEQVLMERQAGWPDAARWNLADELELIALDGEDGDLIAARVDREEQLIAM
jgi:hypothetical protein